MAEKMIKTLPMLKLRKQMPTMAPLRMPLKERKRKEIKSRIRKNAAGNYYA